MDTEAGKATATRKQIALWELGTLEDVAVKIAGITGRYQLENKAVITCAGDMGWLPKGYGQSDTADGEFSMEAAINVLPAYRQKCGYEMIVVISPV